MRPSGIVLLIQFEAFQVLSLKEFEMLGIELNLLHVSEYCLQDFFILSRVQGVKLVNPMD